MSIRDLVIIGGGPGGLSAALYAARGLLDVLIVEKEAWGGQIVTTDDLENYPGGEGNSGKSVTKRMKEQVEAFDNVEFVHEAVTEVDFSDKVKKITLEKTGVVEAKTVIIATGAVPRKLGVPGEKEFTAKGVSYCSTCDAAFMEGLEIFVVGGGNSAVEEAMYLSNFGRKVTVLVRDDETNCDAVALERAKKIDNLEIRYNTSITEIKGDGLVGSIDLVDSETGETSVYEADEEDGTFGIFVYIGSIPQSDLFEGQVEIDDWGYIVAGEDCKTNVDGVYVAGDVRTTVLRQVVTAAADGAVATTAAEHYINENF